MYTSHEAFPGDPVQSFQNAQSAYTASGYGCAPVRALTLPHARPTLTYTCVSAFCALFSYVYERCSHGVYADGMVFLCCVPLLLGILPSAVLLFTGAAPTGRAAANLYHAGVATLTVGSCVSGILEIYGTTSSLSGFYLLAGIPLVCAGAVVYLLQTVFRRRKTSPPTNNLR